MARTLHQNVGNNKNKTPVRSKNDILYYFFLILIPIGIIMRIEVITGGSFTLLFGLIGITTYYLIKLLKNLRNKVKKDSDLIMISLSIIAMSLTIFAKYLYHTFMDVPGLVIIPLFIFISILFIFKSKIKSTKILSTLILYLLITVPIFGLNFYNSPRDYIPKDWYDRYNTRNSIIIKFPDRYNFKDRLAEELSIKAFDLRKERRYYEAIIIYRKALKIESKNPRLYFDISEPYARMNQLEKAIEVLDTAIILDSTQYFLYFNRGLLYHRLDKNDRAITDYNKAILINPDIPAIYVNLALVFHEMKKHNKCCENINRATDLGFDYSIDRELRFIKRKFCE